MKTLEFTDSELEEFRKILNWVIPYRLNDYYMKRSNEEKKTILGQVNTYMKMHNKCICPIYDIEDMADRLRDLNDIIKWILQWGSGSTGVACLNTNRKFIGIESDKTYFDIAQNRINSNIN